MKTAKVKQLPTQSEIEAALSEPFPASEIGWMPQKSGVSTGRGGHADQPWCMATAYLDARAVQKRLDDVFGIFGWKDEYEWIQGDPGGVVCRLSVKWGDEWITKQDGAPSTHIEAFKGGISDALKRAGAKFGIGRYLYYLDSLFADCTFERPKGSREKAKTDGWRDATTKDKVKFYWQTPRLPNWALPKDERDATDAAPQSNTTPVKASKALPRIARTDSVNELYTSMASKGMSEEDQSILVFGAVGATSRRQITEDMLPIIAEAVNEWKPEAEEVSE